MTLNCFKAIYTNRLKNKAERVLVLKSSMLSSKGRASPQTAFPTNQINPTESTTPDETSEGKILRRGWCGIAQEQ